MPRLISAILMLLIAFSSAEARRIKTTRQHAQKTPVEAVAACDTIIPRPGEITLSGYDKPLRSGIETVFVSNNTDRNIVRIVLSTQYLDMQWRQLHHQRRHIDIDLPAKSTRKVDYKAWDRQASFYFHQSRKGRSKGIPYKVDQRIDTIFSLKSNASR